MEPSVEIVVEPPGSEVNEVFPSVVQTLVRCASAVLADRGFDMPDVRVVAASDLASAIDREQELLGMPSDRREGLERVGGVVAGKSVHPMGSNRASVIVPLYAATAKDGGGQLSGGAILAHELAHLVYGVVRDAEVGRIEGVWLPWELAEVVAILAAEEFRVNRLAFALSEFVFNPTDGEGNPVRVHELAGEMYREGLSEALDAVLPGLEHLIWVYRLRGSSLEDLWNEVASASQGIAVYLAHLEAAAIDTGVSISACAHPAVAILEPLWEPLFSYLHGAPQLPQAGTWDDDRTLLRQLGRDGFTAVWRKLGLAARPEGDTFYLSVDDPPTEEATD